MYIYIYAILCYTMLYYTILYYTILYYTILYYTRPSASSHRAAESPRGSDARQARLSLRDI